MKKLMGSLLALSMMITLSSNALEKPGTDDVDFETYRIEKLRGENPEVHMMHSKLAEWRAQAKKATGETLARLKAKIKEYEAKFDEKVK